MPPPRQWLLRPPPRAAAITRRQSNPMEIWKTCGAAACTIHKATACGERNDEITPLRPATSLQVDNTFEVLQVNDAAADADRHGLGAILGAELVHDVPDMDLDGLFGDFEALTDVTVAVTLGHAPENLDFALTQGIAVEVPDQVLRHLGWQMLAPRMHLADHLHELFQ